MNRLDDRDIDDQIRMLVSDSAPPAVERRLRSQLADFRSRLSAPAPVAARYARGWALPAAWWRLGATCAAAVILVAAAAILVRPQASFAEVQAAVLKQPWVYLRTVFADQSVSESWFSPARDISASRARGSARYEDYRLQIYSWYDPGEEVVYRGPISEKTSPASQLEAIGDLVKILFQGDGLPEKPLAHLDFLGSERDKMTVVDQRVDKVVKQEQTWLDYRITVKHTELPDPVRLWLRVDAGTKLPDWCQVEGIQDGKLATFEMQFEYPEKGPADIYALGVPETAKFVDRVPAGDLKLIVETLEAGRERMDNYRAVFVEQIDDPDQRLVDGVHQVFYRKGDLYRRDFVGGLAGGRRHLEIDQPAANVDLRRWWFDRAKLFRYYPVYVQRGSTRYTCRSQDVVDPDGSHHREIDAVQKYDDNSKAGELFPVDYVMRPEFVCRPPMGIGNPHQEPVLDLHPAEGPEGCVLLTVAHTTKAGRVDERGIGLGDVNRFWLDPERDYIALRWEMATLDGTGKETITNQHLVEETARSPEGVWYATKIRLKNAVRQENGKQFDQLYHIYVDFDAELPDSLFEAPKPRKVD